ncbi:MAG: hypothetical protein ACFFB0_10315 [Promethearchaeota archaeon]
MPGPFDEIEKEAENLEKLSKEEFNKKNFIQSISLLEKAKEIYRKLGFQGKIGMLNQRIARVKNLIKHEQQSTTTITKREGEFDKKVKEVETKQQRYQESKLAEQKVLPSGVKTTLEKVKLLVEKAEREETLGKFPRAIERYEYILKLYRSIPPEVINLSNEISEIEKKIALIRTKI